MGTGVGITRVGKSGSASVDSSGNGAMEFTSATGVQLADHFWYWKEKNSCRLHARHCRFICRVCRQGFLNLVRGDCFLKPLA